MGRRQLKLVMVRETVRALNGQQLGEVGGGIVSSTPSALSILSVSISVVSTAVSYAAGCDLPRPKAAVYSNYCPTAACPQNSVQSQCVVCSGVSSRQN
ncbi:MAG: hypothetical protein HJJLKODD_02508 [Phycisphaerae bacterium]|nr:hypothetical protein [Phycisphaerae bacterium]